jgi:hypothetical protein
MLWELRRSTDPLFRQAGISWTKGEGGSMTRVRRAHRYKRRRLMVSAICGSLVVAVAEPGLGAADTFDGVCIGKRVLTKALARGVQLKPMCQSPSLALS